MGQLRVAVQQRHRFFREGIRLLLESQPDIIVIGAVVGPQNLVDLCATTDPDIAVVDLDADSLEVSRSCAGLRKRRPALHIVGVYSDEAEGARAKRAGFRSLVHRRDGFDALLAAVRTVSGKALSPIVLADRVEHRGMLSSRELDVLNLVGAGHTTQEISQRLEISRKTVENHKQRIFTKLDVQNQAHAVAVAVRKGLISPDGIIDLTADG